MTVSAGLWLLDVVQLSSPSFAGVTDQEAAARVLSAAGDTVLLFEARLLATHLVLGALLGWLMGRAWSNLPLKRTALREAIGTSLVTWFVFATALLGMVASYPQLFADRWWLPGGGPASLHRIVTHVVGPFPFDLVLLITLAAILLLAAHSRQGGAEGGKLIRNARGRWLIAFVLILVGLGLAGRGGRVESVREDKDAPLNLLILASDSLRSDRVDDRVVMPELAARLAQGSLFRYAITPIARTYPSWVSTLTGKEPRTHGVRHMFPRSSVRRDVGPTLFTELRDRGYFTFATSDFAGDIFHGFEGGFEVLDTPRLNVDTLATSTMLSGHSWSLPLLRLRFFRSLFPVWKNLPSLADPGWLVQDLERDLRRAGSRPFAGLVFFSAAHFPYAAPYPYYKRGADDYRGPYLYHVPPVLRDRPDARDIAQIRARYDGALSAIDESLGRIFALLERTGLARRTVVIVTGDHGEELYEVPDIAGHGDTIRHVRSQSVPIFITGPGVARGDRSDEQIRLYDLPATALDLVDPRGRTRTFGQGLSLMEKGVARPICVETGIWFWPGRPKGLVGQRLDYPGISELLEVDETTREMVLRTGMEALVETAKERGIIVGNRLWREQLTPDGLSARMEDLTEVKPWPGSFDLKALFEQRCVLGDPLLSRLYGAVVFDRPERGHGREAP